MERPDLDMSTTDNFVTENSASIAATGGEQQAAPRRTRIKLCGLSKPADVEHAIGLGADAIASNTWR